MRHYRCVPRWISNEAGKYITYDIVYEEDEFVTVHDVSSDRQYAEHIVLLLNRNSVSPVHLFDVIEDCLCDL